MINNAYETLPQWLQVMLFLWLARDIHNMVKDHKTRIETLERKLNVEPESN